MKKVRFSKHCLKRMKQRNVNENMLIHELKQLPPFEGTMQWKARNGDKYVISSTPYSIVVITAISFATTLHIMKYGKQRKYRSI